MSRFHDEVLPDNQKEVIRKIGRYCTSNGYYLAGGTAVAIQLGHRRSIDLDWFTQNEALDPYATAADLRACGIDLEITDIGYGSLRVAIGGLPVSFIRYRYPRVGELIEWPEAGCLLASLEDLVSMKIAAATQRGEKKDFFDLVAICSGHLSLSRAIELYQRRFGIDDVGHVMMSLCYFDDAELDPLPDLLDAPSWAEAKQTIKAWVCELSSDR
jgi:hypothetical protein